MNNYERPISDLHKDMWEAEVAFQQAVQAIMLQHQAELAPLQEAAKSAKDDWEIAVADAASKRDGLL